MTIKTKDTKLEVAEEVKTDVAVEPIVDEIAPIIIEDVKVEDVVAPALTPLFESVAVSIVAETVVDDVDPRVKADRNPIDETIPQ